jgi:hypothetical protein
MVATVNGVPYAGSAANAIAVTPSDSTPLSPGALALYVGVAGDVTAIMLSGATVLFSAVPAGSVLPIQVTQVKATGTTASGIVAIW